MKPIRPISRFFTVFQFFFIIFVALPDWAAGQCGALILGPRRVCDPGQVIFNASPNPKNGGPFTYEWSTGATTASTSINITETVILGVTVTNAAGCVAVDTHIVYLFPRPQPVTFTTTPSAPFCIGSSVQITASHPETTGPYSYFWSGIHPGGNAPVVTVSIPFHPPYTVNAGITVADANGCTGTGTITLTGSPLTAQIISDSSSLPCQGKIINLRAVPNNPGGFNITGYTWSTGETGPEIFVGQGGAYRVTVTTSQGCSTVGVIHLPGFLPRPEVEVFGPSVICPGKSGVLSAGGGTFLSFQWSNGLPPIQSPPISAGGNYTVTVTGQNGCTNTASISVEQGLTPPVAITGPLTICSSPPQTITLNAIGPANTTNYSWATGEDVSSIEVNTPANYRVTITNSQGCTNTASRTVQSGDVTAFSLSGIPTLCVGDTGTLRVNQTFVSYAWSNGGTNQINTIAGPGQYTVTVTNVNGCTAFSTYTVMPRPVTININQPDKICPGDTALIAVNGAGLGNFKWSNGAQGQEIRVTAPGAYTVTATDNTGCAGSATTVVNTKFVDTTRIALRPYACDGNMRLFVQPDSLSGIFWNTGDTLREISVNQSGQYAVRLVSKEGCERRDTIQVQVPAVPTVDIQRNGRLCTVNSGETVLLSVSTGFRRYFWNNGDTLSQITVAQPGIYTVQAEDSLGCFATDTIEINLSTPQALAAEAQPYACDGLRTLTVNPDYSTYLWSNGAQSSSIVVDQAGAYGVTVSNADGCTAAAVVTAEITPLPEVSVSGGLPFCTGASSLLAADEGFSAYLWSNGETGSSITVTSGGPYSLTVTDANGCTDEASATVEQLPTPMVNIRGAGSICTGNVSVFTIQGGPWQSFLWSTGETTSAITVSLPGVYSVTATNNNGCPGQAAYTLTVSDSLQPAIQELPYACNGQISLDAGAGYNNYLWSTGAITPELSVDQSGTYAVTVSDATGCSGSALVQVTVPEAPELNLQAPALLCAGSQGQIEASSGFSQYVWSANGSSGPMLTINGPGTYSVTATDNEGCTAIAIVAVLESIVATPEFEQQNLCNGNVQLGISNNLYTEYAWSTGNNEPGFVTNQAGDYTVTLTDAQGCTATFSTNVIIPELPVVNLEVSAGDPCTGVPVLLTVQPGFAQYEWTTGDNTDFVVATNNDTYGITVTDADGCTAVAQIDLIVRETLAPQIVCPENQVLCYNEVTASFEHPTASDNCAVVDILQIAGLPSGATFPEGTTTNTWVARDAAGNTAVCSQEIRILPGVELQLVSLTNESGNNGQGAIDITVNGANGPYTFAWSDASGLIATTEDLQNIPAGDYSVIVRDADGCIVALQIFTVDNTTSSSDIQDSANWQINPNPTTGTLFIRTQAAVGSDWKLRLSDLQGRTRFLSSYRNEREILLDISAFPAGVYLAEIQYQGGVQVTRVVKSN